MNSTRSTPDEGADYTVVGGTDGTTSDVPALVVLQRGSRLSREEYFRRVRAAGFLEVLSIEPRDHSYSVESLTRAYPGVRFVLLNRSLNVGERINLAAGLVRSATFLVIWSTIDPPAGIERARDLLASRDDPCIAPASRTESGEAIPVVEVPARLGRSLRVLSLPLRAAEADTIYPFDNVALYDRQRFLSLGGYDPRISSPHWQRLDFGFRIYLSGRRIRVVPHFRVVYRTVPEPEDRTVDRSYVRFFARNLAFRTDRGRVRIPLMQLIGFAIRARIGLVGAIRIFRDARRWVDSRADQIRRDAVDIVNDWSPEHGT